MQDDPRLVEAQTMPIEEIADRLGLTAGLRRMSGELVGPCPKCGGVDRFGISLRKGQFLCRKCDIKGDGISLVRAVLDLDFQKALAWLVGEREAQIDPAEAALRREVAEQERRRKAKIAEREREKSIRMAFETWQAGRPIPRTPVADYLALRGLSALADRVPHSLRFHPDLPYMVQVDRHWLEVYRGPAMLAEILGPGGFIGLHRTWLDLSQPKGKARIVHAGEVLAAKKTLGSVKGGAIRLVNSSGDPTIVMGEGIETTGAAFVAGAYPQAAYWAGVSLGNMAGQRKLGQGLKYAGLPDLGDLDAFLPPKQCKRLIFVQDGDSDPKLTRAMLKAGLRRAIEKRPDLTGWIAFPGEGVDLNDVLMEPAR
jgi:hypothetical protein